MIVDGLRTDEREEGIAQSARLRWEGGEFRLRVTAPPRFASDRPDASPFLCAALLLAMRKSEDVDVRGPVSPPLLASAERIVDLYASWDPRLYRSRVRADGELDPRPPAAGIGAFISRGVDSLYTAAVPRALPGALTHLVYCDRLEPRHSPQTRAREIELAREAASHLDLPLVVIESNVRELVTPIVGDWEDMVGAGLALLATALPGRLGHVVIPSSDGPTTVGPCGTSPLLDPLFSTAEVRLEHDTPQTRTAKVAWLAANRPDLIPLLKVCFEEDSPGNCGRCGKCLVTMLALEAAGARGLATGFPAEIDLEALAQQRPGVSNEQVEYEALERGLRERGAAEELIAAVAAARERGAALHPSRIAITDRTPDFRRRASRHARLMMGHDHGPRTDAPARQPRRAAPAGPRTTVMMPAYEASATLRESVESVLAQTVPDLELIVVDDGSSVPVTEILGDLRDPRLRVIRHPRNRGLARARNTALAAARAPLVSQLDADDLWEPDYLATVLPRFEDQGVGLVYTNATILGHPTGHDDYIGDPDVHPIHEFPAIAAQCPVPCPTATMRTEAARRVGGYAWWLRQCEDYHLYMKLARAGWRFDYVHRRLARYRWPEPRRGMSYDPRRHDLWELAMFGSIVARHPRTPGPRRQVRNRFRREVENLRAIGAGGLPAANGSGPRVLIDPGSHALLNLGDVAMLQVCVERLRRLVPWVRVDVITSAPELLARHCPGVTPVPAAGLYEWLDSRWRGGPYSPLVGEGVRERVSSVATQVARMGPRAARAALRAELLAREPASEEARAFLTALLGAQAVVASGRGGTADAFPDDARRLLDLLDLANGLGAVTAMLGQGFGPAENPELVSRAASVLPRVDLIAARDRTASLPVLERAGVAADRIVVTGDDALVPAAAARADAPLPAAIGVNVRVAHHSRIAEPALEGLARTLRGAAERHGAELVGIPISLYPHESDADAIPELTGERCTGVEAPRDAIERAGACRVVVTASYHAGVFALAQGVPVVGVAASPYYAAKLSGLAGLFPGGCTVVDLAGPRPEQRLDGAIGRAWSEAEALRPELLAAADEQIAAGNEAYARLAALLGAPGPSQRSSNGSTAGSATWRSAPTVSAANWLR